MRKRMANSGINLRSFQLFDLCCGNPTVFVRPYTCRHGRRPKPHRTSRDDRWRMRSTRRGRPIRRRRSQNNVMRPRGCDGASPGIKHCIVRSTLQNDLIKSRDATTMSTKTKFVLSVATVLGTASAALAMAQYPTNRAAGATIQRQVPTGAYGSDGFASAPGQSPRMTAVYFEPNPAPFKAYTYCASVQLHPSTSRRVLQGEFRFPAFGATPSVSVQIISSISAVPMQVKTLKMVEIPGLSGPIETQIIVEAEPIFAGIASGFYFANLVVIGVPVTPPTKSDSAQLSR
jgi:hypothetical protein